MRDLASPHALGAASGPNDRHRAGTDAAARPAVDPADDAATLAARSFHTGRSLPFPPEGVYGAFADARLLAAWWGPEGFRNVFEHFAFHEGGDWRFTMHGPDGRSWANHNRFLRLQPGQEVTIRHESAPRFTLQVTLQAEAEGTRLTWQQVFDEVETALAVRDLVLPANEQNLDRLTRVLAGA